MIDCSEYCIVMYYAVVAPHGQIRSTAPPLWRHAPRRACQLSELTEDARIRWHDIVACLIIKQQQKRCSDEETDSRQPAAVVELLYWMCRGGEKKKCDNIVVTSLVQIACKVHIWGKQWSQSTFLAFFFFFLFFWSYISKLVSQLTISDQRDTYHEEVWNDRGMLQMMYSKTFKFICHPNLIVNGDKYQCFITLCKVLIE